MLKTLPLVRVQNGDVPDIVTVENIVESNSNLTKSPTTGL